VKYFNFSTKLSRSTNTALQDDVLGSRQLIYEPNNFLLFFPACRVGLFLCSCYVV